MKSFQVYEAVIHDRDGHFKVWGIIATEGGWFSFWGRVHGPWQFRAEDGRGGAVSKLYAKLDKGYRRCRVEHELDVNAIKERFMLCALADAFYEPK